MERRLYRSRKDRMIFGVAGGLAKYFDLDTVLVRIGFVILTFASGLGILAYILLAIFLPVEGSRAATATEVVKENVQEMGSAARELRQGIKREGDTEDVRRRRRNILGLFLVIIGFLFLLVNLNLFWWLDWGRLWPILVIALGLALLLGRVRRA